MKEVLLDLKAEDDIKQKFNRFLNLLKRNQKAGAYKKDFLFEERTKLIQGLNGSPSDNELQLVFSKSLVLDLLLQGWFIRTKKGELYLKYSMNGDSELTSEEIKEKTRESHLLARDFQLKQPSVKEFIEKTERRKLTANGWISIFSLMRDGDELAQSISRLNQVAEPATSDYKEIIDPYLQFVEPGKKCELTGLYLTDIWRYFRHTWITEYKSLPGRSISILIRDAAAENHPVIGIAALGSSMSQLSRRDEWIGWDSETFVKDIEKNPDSQSLDWLFNTLDGLKNDIYIEDLLRDKSIDRAELDKPSEDLLSFLRAEADREKELHRQFPHEAKKGKGGETIDWAKRAETHLFKSKRFSSLAELLQIQRIFDKYRIHEGIENFENALSFSEFRNAIGRLARKWKGQRVGIDIMDIIVCGSVAPYNHLLGGKLVCLLLTSPEVVEYYNLKYGRRESLIASAMGGRPIVRKPKLSFLATTSLYGVGSSQYNRVRMPVAHFDKNSNDIIEYLNLGISEGFGSFHFSRETLAWAHQYLGRRKGGRRVNSIFGEGSNPLMRKLREAIELLGLESEPLLKHENKRIIYGIPLVRNTRNILLGIDEQPDYLIPQDQADSKQTTAKIADYWIKRWLIKRAKRPEVLSAVAQHSKAYPVTHGARVPLYELTREEQGLFPGY